jgi:hypothetical protein
MTIFFKSGSLNLLEQSGPVKACNGIALPLTVPFNPQYKRKLQSYVLCETTMNSHELLIFTPTLAAANRHNTHAIHQLLFVQRILKTKK